jgi:hypothetical protein
MQETCKELVGGLRVLMDTGDATVKGGVAKLCSHLFSVFEPSYFRVRCIIVYFGGCATTPLVSACRFVRACPRAEAEKYSDETGEGSAVFGGLVQLIASALKYSVQTQCTTCIRCASLVARAHDMDAVLEDCLPALKHLPKFFTPKLALAYTPSFLNSLLLLLCRLHPTPPPLLDAVRALVQPPASAAGSKADTAEEEREWDNLIFSCFSELCANCNEADLSSFFSITIFFFFSSILHWLDVAVPQTSPRNTS